MSASADRHPKGVPEGTALLMTTWSDGEAQVVRALLDSCGIPCQVISDITHSVYPVNVDGLGEVRILVPASSLEEAELLIAEQLREGLEALPGGASEGDETKDPDRSGGEPGGEPEDKQRDVP